MKQTVSLILGSGGARGLAHIGVIHWLEENNYDIRSITGCSMGALIGGIHAMGKLDQYEEWVRGIRRKDIFSLLDFALPRSGLVKGDRIINTLRDLVGDAQIEDLPMRYVAVATDLRRHQEVWIDRGPLFDAIRASISMPFLFKPFRHNGRDLVDGGVLNPVPIAPTFSDNTDLKIAVNLAADDRFLAEAHMDLAKDSAPGETAVEEEGDFLSSFRDGFARLTERFSSESDKAAGGSDWGFFDIAYEAFDAMQSSIARQKLAAYPPDHIIELPRRLARSMDFDRASELIDLGYEQTRKQMTRKN